MFSSVIVPLDGSELAERALPYATTLATTARGEMILVRVALPPAVMTIEAVDYERLQRVEINEAESYLARIAASIPPQVPVRTVVAYGRVSHQLLDIIHQWGADAVVMATHGRTGVAHLLFGSVAEALLAESPVPVFLVGARPGQMKGPFGVAELRVLVPLDGSTFAEAALEPATNLVGSDGELTLACVVIPPQHVQYDETGRVIAYLDQQEESRTREAREYLAEVVGRLEQQYPGIRVNTEVRLGDAANGILMAAAGGRSDLVVMATHGRTGVPRALVGSVAGAVLHDASIPVLLVGPHEAHLAAMQEPAAAAIR